MNEKEKLTPWRPKDTRQSGYIDLVLCHDQILMRTDLPQTSRAVITAQMYDYEARLTLSERQQLRNIRTQNIEGENDAMGDAC